MTATLASLLRQQGYEPRRPELRALTWALAPARPGCAARALLLEGPPGAGKSALAAAVAGAIGAELVVYQLHAWTDADELFVGVDVRAAVAGEAEAVRQPGVLAKVAEAAEQGRVVLLLDEVDKAEERAEALLLDWLQTGRVPVRPGVHLRTRLDRVLVVFTSNGTRPLSDALLRRARRVRMTPLRREQAVPLLVERTGLPAAVVSAAWTAALAVAEGATYRPSLQEIQHLLEESVLAESIEDVREALAGWAARDERSERKARQLPQAASLWGEIAAWRRAAEAEAAK